MTAANPVSRFSTLSLQRLSDLIPSQASPSLLRRRGCWLGLFSPGVNTVDDLVGATVVGQFFGFLCGSRLLLVRLSRKPQPAPALPPPLSPPSPTPPLLCGGGGGPSACRRAFLAAPSPTP